MPLYVTRLTRVITTSYAVTAALLAELHDLRDPSRVQRLSTSPEHGHICNNINRPCQVRLDRILCYSCLTYVCRLIEVQLSSQENATLYGFYNASIMNASAQDISQSITGHNARAPSYLLASLTSENASQGPSLPSDTLPTGTGEAATLRYSSSL